MSTNAAAARPASGQSAITRLMAHGDLLIAAVVVGIVVMMVIPLPTALLDVLLTLNISIGPRRGAGHDVHDRAAAVLDLPGLLLVATLFRLAPQRLRARG